MSDKRTVDNPPEIAAQVRQMLLGEMAKATSAHVASECRERASYLKAMEPDGLSTIEQQSMETLFKAADEIERLAALAGGVS